MIRLTKQTDYGIVLMTLLAHQPGEFFNAPDLSLAARLPLPMVSKILKLLARAGLLDSHRGVKGGYVLARPAQEISVADIIGALDGPIAMTECIEDSPDACTYEAHCGVRQNWQRINRAVRRALDEITLEEMAQPSLESPRLQPIGERLVSLGNRQ